MSSQVNPDDFTRPGTRRIRAFSAAANAPLVAGAGWDGHVYIWNVETRTLVLEFATSEESEGVSLALTANGQQCLVATYHDWGGGCVDVISGAVRWHRADLRKVYGLSVSADGDDVVVWFDRRAGLRLDLNTGQRRSTLAGLRMFASSRFDHHELSYRTRFELSDNGQLRHAWPRDSFALLACAFSPRVCVVAESAAAARAIDLASGEVAWTHHSREGAHLIDVDFCRQSDRFVALEYAYTEGARETGPMMTIVHLGSTGEAVARIATRDWSEAVLCADATLVLNGLGELYDTSTGALVHVFDVPR
jgi:hypothetical protein